MISQKLLDKLQCPKCHGHLEYEKNDNELRCEKCRLLYAIREDIPVMLLDEAKQF